MEKTTWRDKYPIKDGLPLGHAKNSERSGDFHEIQAIIDRLENEGATGIEVRRGGGSFNYYVLYDKTLEEKTYHYCPKKETNIALSELRELCPSCEKPKNCTAWRKYHCLRKEGL